MTDDPNGDDAAMTENTADEERSITMSRVIEAPSERVYEAFLTPEDIAVWAPPDGFRADVQEVESEEGGSFRVENNAETEEMEQYSHTFQGTYQELKPDEKIVWTEDTGEGDDHSTVTVTLDTVADGTEVTLRLDGISKDVAEEYGVAEAWEGTLEKLAGQVED
ncbi:SRPBCC domain-containing protein [Natronorubrum halophilum]|uniref:SRPBCC domain-containing protein n=1 Tax=Natronorubrum halophilum TaxID=1702106 RepID=UPI000EF65906|nr:SRPBCC domain-containing protein [Natronorubrum halophilum]